MGQTILGLEKARDKRLVVPLLEATTEVGLGAVLQMPCRAMDNVDKRIVEVPMATKVEVVYVLLVVRDEMDIVDMVQDTISYAGDGRIPCQTDIVRGHSLR